MKFNKIKKFLATVLSLAMVLSSVPATGMSTVKAAGALSSVEDVTTEGNVATVTFDGGIQGKITFLEDGIFRYNVDPSGEFSEYAAPRAGDGDTNKVVARIQQYPDNSDNYSKPAVNAVHDGENWVITAGDTTITFGADAKMSVMSGDKVVMTEKDALAIGGKTVQRLEEQEGEQFFGGGTQNGRFVHTGKIINIANESGWNDGQVSSPSPFYYSTAGYGVLRNTFQNGKYDFGATSGGVVSASHDEQEFDAYYFVSDADNNAAVAQELLQGYFHVTGSPVLLPAYAFYVGHLNAYNRDNWSKESGNKAWTIKGTDSYDSAGMTTYENGGTGTQLQPGTHVETLNGHGPELFTKNIPAGVDFPYEFSAQAVINEYVDNDMPMGFFLPNDGYGCGYGQNGYKMTDDSKAEDRLAAVAANVENLKEFASYAKSKGIATGLWTQSNLTPDAAKKNEEWQLLRDFAAEVRAGVTTLKTDVAWVGYGYDFQLNGVKQAYDIVTTLDYEDGRANTRPNIISLDGWAGSQRYNSVWTGDQTGGRWEYIRFHIPTFIGQSLAGNPNIGCDMDGIWGGTPVISTRDYQWKSFAPQMLDMDGWGTYAKGPYVHGDPFTGVSRMYLKLKAMLMSYTYTNAYAAANIETGNGDKGLPMVRAMFLEFPEDAACYGDLVKYQYMWGENLLVAPVYENVKADNMGNDVRNGIYLPGGKDQVWIDYFTGDQYQGGQVLNSFDAPLWKLPLFVKNGAIIPMFAENNSAYLTDKTQRLVEFWPAGNTDFSAIEDDGTYVENNLEKVDGYGTVDNVSYGDHVNTKYTSVVEGTTATLTAEKAAGTYPGYDRNKDTTFIVHASKAPTALTAMNGETALTEVKADSKEAFDAAKAAEGTFVSFYDAAPAIETFASEKEVKIAEMVKDVKVSGKLYVKFANTDSQANAQTLVIEGFENTGELPKDGEDAELAAPVLRVNEENTTPTSIALEWDKVEGASYYEVEVDGSPLLHSVKGGATAFTHTGLKFDSTHSYRIRSVGVNGHSAWSEEFVAVSKNDPFMNTPKPVSVKWDGDLYSSNKAENAFNQIFESGDSGFHSGNAGVAGKWLTVDYGKAYLFDEIEYYHRPGNSNGVVRKMHVETSLDGIHWMAQPDYTFEANDDMKLMDLSDPATGLDYIGARYVRFQVLSSIGNFFHAYELKVNTIKGDVPGNAAHPFRVGNISTVGMDDPTIDTFQQMYQKESSAHGSVYEANWVGEIQALFGDINLNGISDIYDYAYTAFDVNGGTSQTGRVSGRVKLVPNKKTIKAGETFTIRVTADNVKNMNAYGAVINYDPAKVEYVGAEYTNLVSSMYTQGMTGNWVYENEGIAYVNHNAINMGDQPLVNSKDGVLSAITMKAKQDIRLNDVTDVEAEDFIIDLSTVTIIGPNKTNFETEINQATYGGNDISLEGVVITAGSEETEGRFSSDGAKERAIDDDEMTAWAQSWDEYPNNLANAWLDLEFPEPHTVDGFRYLPTQSSYQWDGGTHEISKYEIWVKTTDSEEYQLAASGEWAQNREWKYAGFEPIANVTNVKLQARRTGDGSNNWFAEAAEIRVVGAAEAAENVPKLYEVEVVNGAMEDGSAYGEFAYNTKLTVTADEAPEGKVFAGWKLGETLVSAAETYTFFVGNNVKLTAVYEETAPEVTAAALLQSVDVTKNAADAKKSDIRYLAQLVLPEGAKLVDAGLVWTNKAATVSDDQLLLENVNVVAGVKATYIAKISNTYQFSVTIKGVPGGTRVPGAIFATYTLDGETYTVHSTVEAGVAK